MPVVTFKSFPLADKGMSWSFSGADGNAIIDRGGWSLFKQVHTWFDDADGDTPETKAAYKLPHHKIVDDEVKTVWRGVTAAMSRLMQQNTQIPDGDRRGCYNHLSRHYREFDEEPPEYGRYSDEEIAEWLVKWGYSREEAESFLGNGEQQAMSRKFGEPTQSQLEKINALAKRPLSKEEVFVFSSKMIGDAMIYHPWPVSLHKSLLEVFKQDALTGVAFMLDHSWAGFARPKPAYVYGRTFDARLKKGDMEGENWALYGDVYIVRGKEKDGVSTDAIIADIEDGTLFDVSVGFGNQLDECSICGNNIWDGSKCEHWPGKEYDGQLCYIIAKPPGYLMELSGVFDGAYPSAEILSSAGGFGESARDMQLIPSFTKFDGPVAQMYRVYSATRGRVLTFAKQAQVEKKLFALGGQLLNQSKGGDSKMDKKYSVMIGDEDATRFISKVTHDETGTVIALDTSVLTELHEITLSKIPAVKEMIEKTQREALDKAKAFVTKEQATEVLGKEYDADTILKFAKEGIQYREELVQDTIEWGIRAQGNDFPADAWRQLLSEPGRTIEAIKAFREGFKKQAEAAIPAGRVSVPTAKEKLTKKLPDEAFEA